MAVAEYITKVELVALESRIMDAIVDMRGEMATKADIVGLATKADVREKALQIVSSIQHDTSPNW